MSRFILNKQFEEYLHCIRKDGQVKAIELGNSQVFILKCYPDVSELGSGCGLTSIALNRRNIDVFASDKFSVLPLLTENIDCYRNQIVLGEKSASIEIVEFDWATVITSAAIPQEWKLCDLIICSDCLYNSSSIEPLLQSIEAVRK